MPQVYHYHPQTQEFLHATEARLDPIDKTPLVPMHSTLVEPPQAGVNHAAVWAGDAWAIVADHRGVEYWLEDGSHHVIGDLDVAPPDGALDTPPPPPLDALKEHALSVARDTASTYRRQIADHVPEERAIAWVLKAAFGSAWALHEQNPTLADSELATAAQAGFAAEAAITGEDAKDLRDRALSKSVLFFQATQVVEGMERLAEVRIPAATTPEELETTIAELRAQEEAAATQLATLKGGANA